MKIQVTKSKVKITATDQVAGIMQRILKRDNIVSRAQEHFWLMGMDKHQRLLFIELLALGEKNMVNLEPREILKVAVLKDAKYCILIHNTVPAILRPREVDLHMTATLHLAAYVLGIRLVDHLIITERTYLSFEEKGIMKDLQKSADF